ncbi:MAG: DUF4249 domain-containing protein [Tannerella sp.]|jgi:hypothetical protein|nr:DUF4249 domain-containing protein [Tannerella sp.]
MKFKELIADQFTTFDESGNISHPKDDHKHIPGIFLFITLIFLLSCCISDYDLMGGKDTAGILVVEGILLENGTTIKLSRTVKLEEDLPVAAIDIYNASVQVIDEEDQVIARATSDLALPGTYVITEPISFAPGMKYALDIRIDAKHYRSEYVSPVQTPEIEELTWKLNDDNSLNIMVSTYDPADEIRYYRWSFEENWEIRASFFGSFIFNSITGELIEQQFDGPINHYYCWDSDYSKSFLLGSADKFVNTVIKNHIIHTFQSGNSRFSYLYSILVKQYGLDKEAYDYFEHLQRNVDESGSLFAPQPSEKAGNIRCLSDPAEPVIGYITASKETTSRLYIPFAELHLEYLEDKYFCDFEKIFSEQDLYMAEWEGLGIRNVLYPGPVYVCVPIKCVDCTLRRGFKDKPSFWPNQHQ